MSAKKIIKTKSFKYFIENLGRGCELVAVDIFDNKIHATCLANTQNIILFKMIFSKNGCDEIINDYNLYNKEEVSKCWKDYLKDSAIDQTIVLD